MPARRVDDAYRRARRADLRLVARRMDDGESGVSDRYTDKPFLRFVDAYVLKAIGHLDEATDAYCTAMVPSLEKSFGLKGTWPQIVAQQMKFPPDMQARILK